MTRLEKSHQTHLQRIHRERRALLFHIRATGTVPISKRPGLFSLVDKDKAELIASISGRWSLESKKGYVACFSAKLHRVIIGAKKGEEVDHINRNPLDNRLCNLRICTHSENGVNKPKYSGEHVSKFKGVSRTPYGRWRARITINKKTILLGVFLREYEAAYAYDLAAKKLHGDFALNGVAPCLLVDAKDNLEL